LPVGVVIARPLRLGFTVRHAAGQVGRPFLSAQDRMAGNRHHQRC